MMTTLIYLHDNSTYRKREDIFTYFSSLNESMATIPSASIKELTPLILSGYTWFDTRETGPKSEIYRTSNGKKLEYFNWDKGKGNNRCPGEFFLVIFPCRLWHDYPCDYSDIFTLCQILIKKGIIGYVMKMISIQNFSSGALNVLKDAKLNLKIDQCAEQLYSKLSRQSNIP